MRMEKEKYKKETRKKCLNVGCGNDIRKSDDKNVWTNLDAIKRKGVDIVHNLEKFPYPFKNEEFDLIYASHILEHLNDYVKTMKELYRILKKGGKLIVIVPHFSGETAHSAFHKLYFKCLDFNYFTKDYKVMSAEYFPLFSKKKVKIKFFKGFVLWNYIIEPLVNICDFTRKTYEAHLCGIFPAYTIEAVLTK